MSVTDGLGTGQQPPMTVPLRHFVVEFCFFVLLTTASTVSTFTSADSRQSRIRSAWCCSLWIDF